MTNKFKLGDEVLITTTRSYGWGDIVGTTAIIDRVEHDKQPYRMDTLEGAYWARESELELVESQKKTFSAGEALQRMHGGAKVVGLNEDGSTRDIGAYLRWSPEFGGILNACGIQAGGTFANSHSFREYQEPVERYRVTLETLSSGHKESGTFSEQQYQAIKDILDASEGAEEVE